jgi:hypothetical protein
MVAAEHDKGFTGTLTRRERILVNRSDALKTCRKGSLGPCGFTV